jgi:hypothetical protein
VPLRAFTARFRDGLDVSVEERACDKVVLVWKSDTLREGSQFLIRITHRVSPFVNVNVCVSVLDGSGGCLELGPVGVTMFPELNQCICTLSKDPFGVELDRDLGVLK